MKRNFLFPFLCLLIGVMFVSCKNSKTEEVKQTSESPRIVNIINFIRQTEPRDEAITDDVLYETVAQQVKQLNQYKFPGTFLLQYDALINPRYQELLKNELNAGNGSEVGAWWEITQPHVEAAGYEWRGRYAWDWHANVGFSTGYTPEEREKLIDVYMEKFKSIFGKYPASVGSWFIDEHTLAYMYDKYGIIASCNCKDQVGTDGYTLWGGYWNQAYYPSRKNAYMPAQTAEVQIPVPVFRMLGSDPIYQYDTGLGHTIQGVISLEPVYPQSGGSRKWAEWFLNTLANDPTLNFNYTQAGQENSFTWAAMGPGLEMQMPILDSLKKANRIRIETLEESGRWFKEQYPVTPPTAFSALTDYRDEGHQTVWFNSRYYRTNLLWKGTSFRFRDIHLFDEQYESDYLTKALTSTQCIYNTLPVVDGFLWSTGNELAGLRLMRVDAEGVRKEVLLESPIVTEMDDNSLQVKCTSDFQDIFYIQFFEDRFEVWCQPENKDAVWFMELTTAEGVNLPFQKFNTNSIEASQNNFVYTLVCKEGAVKQPIAGESFVFQLIPLNNRLVVDCTNQ